MLRAMWCRKAFAVASIVIHSPRRTTVSFSIRRIGDFAWHCADRNALKSCEPTNAVAASAIRSLSSGRKMKAARFAANAERIPRLSIR